MRSLLHDCHLGCESEEPQVKAATDIVHAMHNMGITTKPELYRIRLRRRCTGFIADVQYAVVTGAILQTLLVTCDRLPAMWCRSSEGEKYKGCRILDAEELWFPAISFMLLVLRRIGSEEFINVGSERFATVNFHLSRHCYQAVFHEPRKLHRSGSFPMNARRPSVRLRSEIRVAVMAASLRRED